MSLLRASCLLVVILVAGTGCANSPFDAPPVATTSEARTVDSIRESKTLPLRTTFDLANVDSRNFAANPPPLPASRPHTIRPVRPAREAVWIEGHWSYTGNPASPYEWMSGHWEIPPPGARAWVPSAWQQAADRYVYVRGHWR